MIELKKIEIHDLPEVAEVHLSAFPNSALALLGKEAIRRYYEWQLTGPHVVSAIGAFIDHKLVGFCFGGIFQGALSGFLRKNRYFLLFQILTHPWLLFNHFITKRISFGITALRRSSKPEPAKESELTGARIRQFGILSIAVAPRYQGRGVGVRLMREIEKIAVNSMIQAMGLTVESNNYQAIGFYESQGWEKIYNDGVWKGKMKKTLRQITDEPNERARKEKSNT